jgi:hypothetical protein
MASQEPPSVASNFYLKKLDSTTNNVAYNYNFIDIKSVEPSLGVPSVYTYANPICAYYFPLITNGVNYSDSRRMSNSNNTLVYFNNNIGIGTNIPNKKLTVSGTISGTNNIIIGNNNISNSAYSSILGGNINTIGSSACNSTIGSGSNNIINGCNSFIGSGTNNTILSAYGYIGGGFFNQVNNSSGLIFGGTSNIVNGNASNINGGGHNIINGASSNINGGTYNIIDGDYNVIAGGIFNHTDQTSSNINGGMCNNATNQFSTIAGGRYNTSSGFGANIAGGTNNTASGCSSVVAGGYCNTASGNYSTSSGGYSNTISGNYSSIINGKNNEVSGDYSSIIGGQNNLLNSNNSFILGSNINSGGIDNTTFVENLSVVYNASVSGLEVNGSSLFKEDSVMLQNLTVFGYICALSGLLYTATNFLTSEAIQVVNVGNGPALSIEQDLNIDPIGIFISNQKSEVLHIGNTPVNPVDGTTGYVGVNTSTPNVELTVNGSISSNNLLYSNVIFTSGGNSDQWNSVYNTVNPLSANWQSTYITVSSLSSNSDNTYNTVNSLSANWQSTYITVSSLSGNWSNSSSWVNANSANATFISVSSDKITTNSLSAITLSANNIYANYFIGNGSFLTNISADVLKPDVLISHSLSSPNISAVYFYGDAKYLTNITASIFPDDLIINNSIYSPSISAITFYTNDLNSDYWNQTYYGLNSLSGNWQSGYNTLSSLSANWQSEYNTLNSLSATWNSTTNTVSSLSSNWSNVYNNVNLLSGNWSNSSSWVNANSANATFTISVSAPAISGTFYGDGSFLTGVSASKLAPNVVISNSLSTVSISAVTFYTNTLNSDQWNSVYTNVNSLSDNWQTAYKAATGLNLRLSNYLPLSGGELSGPLTINSDLNVNGSVIFTGSATYINTVNSVIGDSLVYIASGNNANINDIGIVGHFTQSPIGYQHTGIVRRADTQQWTLFSGVTSEPISAVNVTWTDPSFKLDTLAANISAQDIATTNLKVNNNLLYTSSSTNSIGVNTITPNANLTVVGSISATGIIYGQSFSSVATVIQKYSINIGDNSTNPITVTHNLNTTDVTVLVYERSTSNVVYPSIKINNLNSIILTFNTTPTTNQYRVVVVG